jgi:hypothetical protein
MSPPQLLLLLLLPLLLPSQTVCITTRPASPLQVETAKRGKGKKATAAEWMLQSVEDCCEDTVRCLLFTSTGHTRHAEQQVCRHGSHNVSSTVEQCSPLVLLLLLLAVLLLSFHQLAAFAA